MRVVIVGAGQVGANLARYLSSAGKEVVVVENDPAKCAALAEDLDVDVVFGSGTSPATLRKVGLGNVELFVAVTASDEANLMAVNLAVGDLPEGATTMARLRSRELLEDKELHRRFRVDVVVNPEEVLGRKILRILSIPGARDVLSFEEGKVDVVAFRASADWPIVGRPLLDLSREFGHLNVIVGAILRGPASASGRQKVIIPDGKTVIQEGDLVYFMLPKESAEHLQTLRVSTGKKGRSVVIAGGGDLSIQLAQTLSENGYLVRLMIGDPDEAMSAAEQLPRAIVLQAYPTELDVLTGLLEDRVDTYIAACAHDAINVLTTVLAQKMGVDRSIVVTQDATMVGLIKAVDVNIVLNPFELAAAFVLRNTHEVDILEAKLLAGEDAEALEFIPPAGSPLLNKPLRDAHFPTGTLIAMIVRQGEVIIPRGADRILPGDRVIALSRRGSVPALERLVRPKRGS